MPEITSIADLYERGEPCVHVPNPARVECNKHLSEWITRVVRDLRSLATSVSRTPRTVLRDHRAQAFGDHGVAILCGVLIDERSA